MLSGSNRTFMFKLITSNIHLLISRAMIKALSDENSELKKNLSLAGSSQNEIKVWVFSNLASHAYFS